MSRPGRGLNEGYVYHRCDGKRDKYRKVPGRYGLFTVSPPDAARGWPVGEPHMITSADSVEPLLHYRGFLKPYLWCYVAKAEVWR